MRADEARNLADKVNREHINSQYSKVHKSIDTASKAGKYECYFDEHMKESVSRELIKEGFEFTTNSHRNEIIVTIKW